MADKEKKCDDLIIINLSLRLYADLMFQFINILTDVIN